MSWYQFWKNPIILQQLDVFAQTFDTNPATISSPYFLKHNKISIFLPLNHIFDMQL